MLPSRQQKAQTAVELAVFGSILIFTLGVIINSVTTRGNEQQAAFRANRLALTLSFSSTASMKLAARSRTSVLIIEDRLTAASAKYGAVDRTPYMVQATATHSTNMFMPVDFGDDEDLPVLDVFVNGKHFTFTTSKFKTVTLPTGCPGGASSCPEWEGNCLGTEGCAKLYTVIDNHPLMERWCDDGLVNPIPCPVACSVSPVPGCNLSADERFDLDRNNLDGKPGDIVVPPAERKRFSWQWYLVMAAADFSNMAEGINLGENKNVEVDVDQDLKLEHIAKFVTSAGVITSVDVLDSQDGDIDLTHNDGDLGWQPGFTRDARVYTFVKTAGPGGGTYLQIDEGKLFSTSSDTRQYIRTVSKKDTIDMIERVFKVSNNTGNLCSPAGVSQQPAIEICAVTSDECFNPEENRSKTCFDIPNLMLFIRSRIQDFRGRKWITLTGEDPYLGFTR